MARASVIEVEPIRREGASNIVVDRLLGLVKAGRLVPGDRLPSERQLAEMFGVSRPTVREALRGLSVLGVVEIRHGGGVFVSRLSAADLLQPLTFFLSLEDVTVEKLYHARRVIEGEIAALAASHASNEDVAILEALIEEQKRALANAPRYRDVDTEFHRKLAELADNPFLARAAQSLNILGLQFRKIASETPKVLSASVRDHLRIVDAVRASDADAARRAMADHMDCVLRTTREAMEGVDG
jgi:GntR family transcriptional repressor for pyruvate dehydrogenase complex